MPRKALLCVLQLDLRSITCPGVLLKDKEELYLSVSVLGQYKKTQCVPAAFPLFFQEKLVFEKAFADIVDPGDLVELLELDTAVLELIQLVPPGKILATYEENTRDFLFPDPKRTCGHHGLDREILMKRSPSFTGIAPKLRFSTSSLITESLLSSGRSHIQGDLNRVHHSTPNGKLQIKLPKKITLSPEKSRHSLATKNYEQPTIASKSRSPSPYTKRRMCELSEEARQRLAHLSLGPYEFRRETDKPPFVVRRVEQPSPGIKLHAWCPTRESIAEASTKVDHDPSLLGSYRPKKDKAKSTHGKGICNEDGISYSPNKQSHSAGFLEHSAPPTFQKHSLSSVLNRSSLRERSPKESICQCCKLTLSRAMWLYGSASHFDSGSCAEQWYMHTLQFLPTHEVCVFEADEFFMEATCTELFTRRGGVMVGEGVTIGIANILQFSSGWPSPANGDEIHKRVKNILRTHSARQRLVFDESNSSKGDLTKTRESSRKAPLSMTELQSSSPVQQNATVHLDNGEYWSRRAAVYKGKPRRAIFEESLEKIYRNMYQKASGTVSDQKTHS